FELDYDPIRNRGDFGQWFGKGNLDSEASYLYGARRVAVGARWSHLYLYYNLYKQVTLNGGVPALPAPDSIANWRTIHQNLPNSMTGNGDLWGGYRTPRLTQMAYV